MKKIVNSLPDNIELILADKVSFDYNVGIFFGAKAYGGTKYQIIFESTGVYRFIDRTGKLLYGKTDSACTVTSLMALNPTFQFFIFKDYNELLEWLIQK